MGSHSRITVTLPWPPAETSPNAKGQGKWRTKSEAAKKYKATCIQECRAQKIRKMDAEAVSASVTFHAPQNRAYDLDNALARSKQGLDAVAEAIGVDDSKWHELRLLRGEKVKGGAVLIELRGAK